MNELNRLPLTLLFGMLLSLVLNTQMAQGQVIRPSPGLPAPPFELPDGIGTPHHVIGSVRKGTCPSSLYGATLQVEEFWYTLANGTLMLPSRPTDGRLDPLSFQGRTLEQGRVLGKVILTGDATTFDVQWLEVPFSTRVPWVQNVQNGRTGDLISVYRLLKLQVNLRGNSGFFSRVNSPVPLIMFFGTETMKNVGTIKVDCFSIGG